MVLGRDITMFFNISYSVQFIVSFLLISNSNFIIISNSNFYIQQIYFLGIFFILIGPFIQAASIPYDIGYHYFVSFVIYNLLLFHNFTLFFFKVVLATLGILFFHIKNSRNSLHYIASLIFCYFSLVSFLETFLFSFSYDCSIISSSFN